MNGLFAEAVFVYLLIIYNQTYNIKGNDTMDREKNILLAKKYMVESIYRSANIEGIGMTFPETQTICDGMSVSGHSVDDINAVNDLKNAWRWIFNNPDSDIGIETLCQLNRIAGKFTVINAGSVRDMYDEPIRVPLYEGKDYYPPLPPPKEEINALIKDTIKDNSIDNALNLFCLVCKMQIFNDGNKRTATLISNMFMMQNGLGILSIPVEKKLEFYNALTNYYDNDCNKSELKSFLEDYCITGNKCCEHTQSPTNEEEADPDPTEDSDDIDP